MRTIDLALTPLRGLNEELHRQSDGANEAQWQALAEKALEGAPLSKITTKTEHGVPVRPLYRRADWGADASGLP